MPAPITFADCLRAREIIRGRLVPTPLLNHPTLDAELGTLRVLVKHENHQPTGSFKIRNGIVAMASLTPEQRARGVVAATRGNHGQGLALAGKLYGASVTICVPRENSVEKNAAMRALGATVVEAGRDYEEAVGEAERLVRERDLVMLHSTSVPTLAGAATLTLEICEQAEHIDAMIVTLGGGSQAVGALTVLRERAPHVRVYGVQAANAPAIHDGIAAGVPLVCAAAPTLADGLATGRCHPLTFDALRTGLSACVLVSEAEIAEALRVVMRTTHNMLEGAAAAAFAGLYKLRDQLAGQTVAVVLSGGNIDQPLLARVLSRAL